MAEIVALFVGPVTEVVKCLGEPIMRQFNYLCCFNSNKQNLRDVEKDLLEKKEEVRGRVSVAENNNEQILPAVTSWLCEVDKIQGGMNGIDNQIRDVRSGCSAAKFRFLLSRRVRKTSEAMEKLLSKCPKSNEPISCPQPPPSMEVPHVPETPAPEFESRKQIEDDVMAILRDEKVNVMGICGMGGLGKTTLANKIKDRVKVEHLFGESVMAVVSQQPDKLKIQGELAENLGLELKGITNLSSRAHRLRTRLNKEGKSVLVVLDDVWEDLDLEELGLTCKSGYRGCTILLTSRDRGVLVRMDAQPICEMKILSDIEAWSLFQQNVGGTCLDDQTLLSIAQDVIKECRGLPLAIVTVSRALKGHDKPTWQDALQQLKSSNPEDLENVLKDVYTPIKLSYDFLSENAKSIFLLCCLFPEDDNIFLEDLTAYAMGLSMFEGSRNLGQVRNKIYLLVGKLKNRCLLLEGSDEHNVRMHDVVRDVAIFIASSKEKQLIRCGGKCAWISTLLEGRTVLFEGAIFPNLRLLQIQGNKWKIRDNSFKGMINLNVLSMRNINSLRPSLPATTILLKGLRTLLFHRMNLETISIVGELENLEVFICRKCPYIKMLPIDVGRLVRLKLLELSNCQRLNRVAPGIISSLLELEELKMVSSFNEWEAEKIVGKERTNAALSELQSLSSLTCLSIEIKDSRLIAENFNLPPNVGKYDISIPTRHFDGGIGFERNIEVRLGENEITSLGNWFAKCLSRVERISLYGEGSKVVDLRRLPQNMRHLMLGESSTVKKLVNLEVGSIATVLPCLEYLSLDNLVNLEEIFHMDGPTQEGLSINAFQSLKKVHLSNLPALRHWWKSRPDQHNTCFPQLQELYISDCKMMEQVFFWIEERDEIEIETIIFPKLKILKLSNLPSLTSFSKGILIIGFPQLAKLVIDKCPQLSAEQISFPSHIERYRITIGSHRFFINNQYDREMYLSLQRETILGDWILQCVSSVEYMLLQGEGASNLDLGRAHNMRRLIMRESSTVKKLVGKTPPSTDDCSATTVFPFLESLELQNLPSLEEICHIDGPMLEGSSFRNLRELRLFGLPALKHLWRSNSPYHDDAIILQLQSLSIRNCEMMEQILFWNDEYDTASEDHLIKIMFPNLRHLSLSHLPRLKAVCNGIESIEFPLMSSLRITECQQLKSVVSVVASSNDIHDNSEHGDDRDNFSSDPEKVVFSGQKTLDIGGYNITSSSISADSSILWSDKILIQDFGLQVLAVSGFDIGSLFSSSIVTNLNNLRELNIYKCAEMVKVIEDDDDKGEMKAALFPRLKELHIRQLPKLEMFCGWKSCALDLPSLENVRITSCSEMKIFSVGSITTPKLRTVCIDGKNVISNTKDLNVMLHRPSSEEEEEKRRARKEEVKE